MCAAGHCQACPGPDTMPVVGSVPSRAHLPPVSVRPAPRAPVGCGVALAHPLLALQRAAGNLAVGSLLDGQWAGRRPLVVLRYEAGEHAQLGPDRVVTVNCVSMTEGDLIAMGDFYANPEDMYKAAPAE